MHRMLRLVLAALTCALATAPDAAAQCSAVAGTGCGGALGPNCNGTLQIGGTLQVTCISSGRGAITALMLGGCATGQVAIGPPLPCGPTSCAFAIDLSLVLFVDASAGTVPVPIPNDPNLVGATACAQCIDLLTPPGCLSLSEGIQFTFTP